MVDHDSPLDPDYAALPSLAGGHRRTLDRSRHIAFVCRGDTILSAGRNHFRPATAAASSASQRLPSFWPPKAKGKHRELWNVHAEEDALSNFERQWARTGACRRRSSIAKDSSKSDRGPARGRGRMTLWILRMGLKGELRNSRPCNGCCALLACYEKIISHVVFSEADGSLAEIRLRDLVRTTDD